MTDQQCQQREFTGQQCRHSAGHWGTCEVLLDGDCRFRWFATDTETTTTGDR